MLPLACLLPKTNALLLVYCICPVPEPVPTKPSPGSSHHLHPSSPTLPLSSSFSSSSSSGNGKAPPCGSQVLTQTPPLQQCQLSSASARYPPREVPPRFRQQEHKQLLKRGQPLPAGAFSALSLPPSSPSSSPSASLSSSSTTSSSTTPNSATSATSKHKPGLCQCSLLMFPLILWLWFSGGQCEWAFLKLLYYSAAFSLIHHFLECWPFCF